MKYFDWTEEKNYTLALLVLKYKGYKTTDIKQLEKWEVILDKIKTKPGFEDLAIKPIPLQTHFKRMQEETLRRWEHVEYLWKARIYLDWKKNQVNWLNF